MTVTISADDPRTIRAIELAAEADQWLTGHNRDGEEVYGVPSQSHAGHYYIVTRSSCDCPDFTRERPPGLRRGGQAEERTACKHILAVRLHRELVKAQQRQPRTAAGAPPRRGHLRVLSNEDSRSTRDEPTTSQ